MTALTEGNSRIEFPDSVDARKFDDPQAHGLLSLMRVDFVVALADRVFYIEIKDPGNPRAREQNAASFVVKFKRGELDRDLEVQISQFFIIRMGVEKLRPGARSSTGC